MQGEANIYSTYVYMYHTYTTSLGSFQFQSHPKNNLLCNSCMCIILKERHRAEVFTYVILYSITILARLKLRSLVLSCHEYVVHACTTYTHIVT